MHDFFLIERATQVQRLRAARSGNRIEIPGRMGRVGHTSCARRLFQTIDQICLIPLMEKRSGWLARLRQRGAAMLGLRRSPDAGHDQTLDLTQGQRETILEFERRVVELQLEDPADSPPHEAILAAILQDQPTFSGLKPLQFHTQQFPHELLFPSWLNLYTALVLPAPDSSQSRFSRQQIRTIFQFLAQLEDGRNQCPYPELIGVLTFLANRCPPREACTLIQQLINLAHIDEVRTASEATIQRLRESSESAEECLTLIKHWSVFETCARGDQVVARCDLGAEMPQYGELPESVTERIRAWETAETDARCWATSMAQVATLYEKGGGIDQEYADFLARRADDFGDWLSLLVPGGNDEPVAAVSQRLLARMACRVEASPEAGDLASVHAFARVLAPRLGILGKQAAAVFEKEFIDTRGNRESLLRSTQDAARRRKISQQLLAHAAKAGDWNQLFIWITLAAVMDPDGDSDRVRAIGRTISVLKALETKGFISANQLEELAADIRQSLPAAVEYLVAPLRGAAAQTGRLSKLYLALYEECEKFAQYGETGNFGLTVAAYGNLDRTIKRDF